MTKKLVFKRKREGRTNYRKRLSLLVSRKPRAVIRKTLRSIIVQIVEYDPDGDKVIAAAQSRDLKKFGFPTVQSNINSAYLVGLLCGKLSLEKGIKEVVVDLGLQRSHPGGKLFSAVKGLKDAGMDVPAGDEALPSDERLSSKEVADVKQKILG